MILSNKFFIIIFSLVPFFLITGPAIPDIIITFSGIYFLVIFLIIKKNYEFFFEKLFTISFIFWISIVFISFFAFDKIKSFQDSIIFIRLLLIPTVCIYLFFNDDIKIKRVIFIIFVCVIFVLIDTLFQYFNYNSEHGFQEDLFGFKTEWYGRLTGPFGDELIPGAYISKFGLLGYLFFYFIKKFKYKTSLEVLYLSTIGLVCFASGERMAFATYFLALFFLLLFFASKRLTIFFSIILSIIFILISIKFHPFYNDYKIINSTHYHQGLTIEKYFDCDDNISKKCKKIINLQPSFIEVLKNFSSSAYGEIFIVGLNLFKDNPITGIGISNYQTACLNILKYKNLMVNYKCASHPHNIYIQWLSEGGLISFTLFLIFLVSVFYIFIKGKNQGAIKYISIATAIILFWPIMSSGSLIKNWNGVLTFYIIGLCVSMNKIKIN